MAALCIRVAITGAKPQAEGSSTRTSISAARLRLPGCKLKLIGLLGAPSSVRNTPGAGFDQMPLFPIRVVESLVSELYRGRLTGHRI